MASKTNSEARKSQPNSHPGSTKSRPSATSKCQIQATRPVLTPMAKPQTLSNTDRRALVNKMARFAKAMQLVNEVMNDMVDSICREAGVR